MPLRVCTTNKKNVGTHGLCVRQSTDNQSVFYGRTDRASLHIGIMQLPPYIVEPISQLSNSSDKKTQAPADAGACVVSCWLKIEGEPKKQIASLKNKCFHQLVGSRPVATACGMLQMNA